MPIQANEGVLDIENATLRSNAIVTLTNLVTGNDVVRATGAPTLEVYGDPNNGGTEPTIEIVSNVDAGASSTFTRLTSNAGVFTIQSGTNSAAGSKGDIAFTSISGATETEHMRIQGSTGDISVSSNLTVNGNILYTKPTSVLVDSNVVAEYTGPHLRGAAKLKKYPEIIFEEGKFDANDSTNTYIQAGYTVTASSQYIGNGTIYRVWKLFDGILGGTAAGQTWIHGNLSSYNTSGDYVLSPANNLGTGADNGEWVKLELPNKITLERIHITHRDGVRAPEDFKVYGSIDNVNWVEILSETGASPALISGTSYTADVKTTAYKYLGMVIKKIVGSGYFAMETLELYGYEEDPPLGDTSIDTTFTSIMNTPQTTGANVYVDGNLGATFTNQVTGPTPVGTSAPRDTTGKYWELNGTLTSNITVEANTFLEGDQPHAVSVWFNSSNLETNTSNSCIFSIGTEERLDHQGIVYQLLNRDYKTEHKILASNAGADDEFGYHVALSADGNYAIVGAPFEDTGYSKAGSAYIYVKSGTGWSQQAQLTASNAGADDEFGKCVALSADGTYAIVGAHKEDTTASGAGSAYIFIRSGTGWSQQAQLTASNAGASDMFGHSVSINGNGTYAVVGAKYEDTGATNAGAAYVFFRNGGTSWSQQAQLGRSSPASYEYFGESVAISSDGSYIVVGVPYYAIDYDQGGTAVIFIRSGTSWSQQAILPVPAYDGTNNYQQAHVGMSVDISDDGTYAVIGGPDAKPPGMYDNYGVAIVFIRSGTSWSLQTVLTANPNFSSYSYFGYSVAINGDGDYIMVGQYESNPGKGFIFSRSVTSWSQKEIISPSDNENGEWMGYSVDIADDATVMLGAPRRPTSDRTGAAYIVHRDTFGYAGSEPKLKLQANTWHNLTYAYQGEGGSKVTYLDGRKVAEDQAEDTFGDYPPFAMTGYSQGGYVVSASSQLSAYVSWFAFDDETAHLSNDNSWICHNSPDRYNQTSGIATSDSDLTTVDGVQKRGEWIQMEFPDKMCLSYIALAPQTDTEEYRAPKEGVIAGSNDGTTWETLHAFANQTSWTDNVFNNYVVNTNVGKGYRYVRIIVEKVQYDGTQNSNRRYTAIADIKLYGHRENDLVRLPDPTNVLKYPHIAMSGYAQRGYNVTPSVAVNGATTGDNIGQNRRAWMAFNGITDGSVNSYWQMGDNSHYTNGSGDAVTSHAPIVPGHTTRGGWLKLELPHKLLLNKVIVHSQNAKTGGNGSEGINSAKIYGSNNDTSWDVIKDTYALNYADTSVTVAEDTISTSTAYKYIIFQITKSGGGPGAGARELEFYGTGVDSIPIQIGGGNIDKVANFRVYDKFVGEDQALEIWDAQKDEFGRAKSSMTLYKGRLGLGTTEPEGRLAVLDEPHNLEEFPPRAMTGYKNYFEGHGEFCVRASPAYITTSYIPWKAFDKVRGSESWHSLSNYSSGVYTGSSTLGGIRGDYLVLKLPYKINLKSIAMVPRQGLPHRGPGTGVILGSNDEDNWEQVHSFSGITYTDNVYASININTTKKYSVFAMVVTNLAGTGVNTDYINLAEWKLFGTREQGQSVLHDGQLTLTKNLNVPRIGPALDADDTPRRDRLVVEYNTSTNPTFEGAVRDTSGRGNDGVFYGGASYSAADKAFSLDGTDDYVQTESPSPLSQIHSMSAWIKMGSQTSINSIMHIGTFGTSTESRIFISGNVLHATIFGSTIAANSNGLSQGRWYHIVYTFMGGTFNTTNVKLFIDGTSVVLTQTQTAATSALTGKTITIGSVSTGGEYFKGDISNPQLYDTALTASEVKTLYDMGRTGSVANPQPLHIAAPLYVRGDTNIEGRIFNPGFGMIIPLVNSQKMRVTQSSTGSDVSFVVPGGVSRIYAKIWGAGGGGGAKWGWNYSAPGGGGGFTHGVIATTPGETLTLIVGVGGTRNGGASYGGGGYPTSTAYAGSGGGRSAIRRGSTELITAGGGGGGSSTRSSIYGGEGNAGGAGGGLQGQNGSAPYDSSWDYAGAGGGQSLNEIVTLSYGGVVRQGYGRQSGTGSGSQFQGGHDEHGGSGGGGWYGGGSGDYREDDTMGGGGGGSGYVGGCAFGQTMAGRWTEPGNIEDVDYATGIAYGGQQWNTTNGHPTSAADLANHNGKPGFIVIYY